MFFSKTIRLNYFFNFSTFEQAINIDLAYLQF